MSAAVETVEKAVWRPRVNPWIVGVVVAMAAFMEALDMSIANVALPHIAGNLGASNSESTWVLTSYLVATTIVLPLSGWLVKVFGRKNFFMTCIALFTASSLLCGMAPSLGMLLFFRILQGAGGGGMIPMVQAIMADSFPEEKRGLAFSLVGVTAVVAPAVGPTLGGWITDNFSWRWIFYINIPIGFLTLALIYVLVEDPPFLERAKAGETRFDLTGFALLAIGVSALQTMLDKGQEDDWLGSHFIVALAVTSVVCLTSLAIWEWFHKEPIIDVKLFKSFNFTACNLMLFVLGIAIFASMVTMPLFLETLMGYTAQTAGLVLSAGAIVVLLTLPVVGQLSGKLQARYLVAFGWIALAISMYVSARATNLEISFRVASWFACLAERPPRFLVCAHHRGRLRWLARRKEQRRFRNHELYAHDWTEHWNLDGGNHDRTPFPVSPIDTRRTYGFKTVPGSDQWTGHAADPVRSGRAHR